MRQPIFLDDGDRSEFLALMRDIVGRYHWYCHAYCLMGNHYHLLIEAPHGNLSIGMRQLGAIYTQRFNRLHNRAGHLFRGDTVLREEVKLQDLTTSPCL